MMLQKTITIQNKLGLHARAAAKFVELAARFASEIYIHIGDKVVNGKSIMGVLMLAASQGTEISLSVEGEDEQAAMDGLCHLINDKFGEGE